MIQKNSDVETYSREELINQLVCKVFRMVRKFYRNVF
jgi:hypothetical protein